MTTKQPDQLVAQLIQATGPDPADVDRLHRRLAGEAWAGGLVDVAVTSYRSPIGVLLLAATRHGLVRVAFAGEDHREVLQRLSDRLGPRVLQHPPALADAVAQLEEYFAGARQRFDLPVDLGLASGFRRTVLEHLSDIAFGSTESYGEVARAVGNPAAVRAVGTACATNPLPVVIPCHRVVRSDGSLGGYLGGLPVKRALLTLEGAAA